MPIVTSKESHFNTDFKYIIKQRNALLVLPLSAAPQAILGNYFIGWKMSDTTFRCTSDNIQVYMINFSIQVRLVVTFKFLKEVSR